MRTTSAEIYSKKRKQQKKKSIQPRKGSLVISFAGLLNLLEENTVKAVKWLKLSKLISRLGHAASSKLRKSLSTIIPSNDCAGITLYCFVHSE